MEGLHAVENAVEVLAFVLSNTENNINVINVIKEDPDLSAISSAVRSYHNRRKVPPENNTDDQVISEAVEQPANSSDDQVISEAVEQPENVSDDEVISEAAEQPKFIFEKVKRGSVKCPNCEQICVSIKSLVKHHKTVHPKKVLNKEDIEGEDEPKVKCLLREALKNKHCEVLVSCSVRKFYNFCMEGVSRKSSHHATACELLVISKNCMQANGTACRLIELHAG